MLLSLLALVTLAQAGDRINYRTDSAPIRQILQELSARSGVKLKFRGTVGSEPLIVDVQEVSLVDLMEKIAEADGAEWSHEGEAYILSRSPALERAQAKAEVEYRRAAIQEALDEEAKELRAKSGKLKIFESELRLGSRVAMLFGANELATIPYGKVIVYASNPTRMQRRLPVGITSILDIFDKEMAAAIASSTRQASVEYGHEYRVLATVSRDIRYGYEVSVGMQAQPNHPFFCAGTLIRPRDVGIQFEPSEIPEINGDPILEMSESAKQFIEFMNEPEFGGTPFPTSISAKLNEPERYDPLSWVAADLLRGYSHARKRSLVASVPDLAFTTIAAFASNGFKANRFKTWLSSLCIVDESKPGWMVVSPKEPIMARQVRVDRGRLGIFCRLLERERSVSLATQSAFVASMPRLYFHSLAPDYFKVLHKTLRVPFSEGDLGLLRVYGQLTPSQREALASGAHLLVADLNSAAKAELADWIYHCHAEDMLIDPTDAFPNGVVDAGELLAEVEVQHAVIPIIEGKELLSKGSFDADALGLYLVLQKQGLEVFPGPVNAYVLGQQRTWQVRFRSGPVAFSGELQECLFDPKPERLLFEKLPESFRKAVSEAMADLDK